MKLKEAIPSPVTERKDEPLKILIVDDHEENIISLESLLENEERILLRARNGQEALKIALEHELAIILLDVQMPDMDGFEVARLLKENPAAKDISIIFVTAISKDHKFTIQGYQEGAVDYLHKPLDNHLVNAKIQVFEKLYRQRLEQRQTNEKLISLNRQLDEFVYIVSHDLKAPLRGLASLANFLEDELGENPKDEIVEILTLMKNRTNRMQQMIDGILHYSRLGNSTGEREPVNVKDLITNIVDLIDPPSHIRIEYPDVMPVFMAERIKLHEVFQNLISNAIKYNNKEKGFVKITYKEYPKYVEFSVSDNGPGIKSEYHQKIFGIFQTLVSKDKAESTGIGLTIVKKIVEQQGGKVSVNSNGEGAEFVFTWNKEAIGA